MKLLKIAFTLATLIACSNALAGTDVAFQQVLDRNANPYIAKGDHDNRIFWSGMIKGIAGIRTATQERGSNNHPMGRDLVLPRANIYMDAVVNDWAMAHVALSLHQLLLFGEGINIWNMNGLTFDETQGNAYYTRSGIFTAFDGLSYRPYKFVDEAFVTLGNLNRNPVFFRMGLGRVDFGLYDRDEILINWTTLLTETQAVFAKLGFMDASGFFGSVYAFRGLAKGSDLSTAKTKPGASDVATDGYPHINNGGASIGYCMSSGNAGIKFVVDAMYNIAGGVNLFRTMALQASSTGSAVYDKEIPGLHVGIKGHYKEFDFAANYVTALKKFHQTSLILVNQNPGAASAGVGVHFKMGQKASRFGIGYQMTKALKNAANTAGATTNATGWLKGVINEHRGHADLTVEVLKNVTAGVHYAFEAAYKGTFKEGKKPNNTHTAFVSLTTKIA